MQRERYPGEQRGLTLFLAELQPVVELVLGQDHLLWHAVRRALQKGSLESLRHARQVFNNQPREIKQLLSLGMVEEERAGVPSKDDLLDSYATRQPEEFVSFDVAATAEGDEPVVRLRHELVDIPAIRVMVRPGTLPSSVASKLRAIADLIERDRRLLSQRFWSDRHLHVEHDASDSVERG
ncbi:MAG TPA: hypothetical protein VHL31_13175 [Geminicoccus sp.]|jgi:hypothetical protein|uniref:hypothetical protein n=1 Tax=Geminicoccus sp. TaxID=2024832 RepID=UPI002E30F636|nr:hypothetical protein [Geminicoccus sp.]HEX2527233.1 hypothetical protein [Geminicoccus sp.]